MKKSIYFIYKLSSLFPLSVKTKTPFFCVETVEGFHHIHKTIDKLEKDSSVTYIRRVKAFNRLFVLAFRNDFRLNLCSRR